MAGCPQACQLKSYGTTLSYASLSSYNTEELLGDNHTDLYEKYSHALEMQNVSAAFIIFDVSMPNSMLIRLIWTRNIYIFHVEICWSSVKLMFYLSVLSENMRALHKRKWNFVSVTFSSIQLSHLKHNHARVLLHVDIGSDASIW